MAKNPYYDISGVDMVTVTTALKIIDTGVGDWKARIGAKEASIISRRESGIGKTTHGLIEKNIITKQPIKFTKAHGLSVRNAIGAYQLWCTEMKENILQCEALVYSDTHSYAGTADAIGMDAVFDWKTSGMIHPSYWLQLAAYAAAIMEMAAKSGTYRPITRLVVVRLDKDLGHYAVEERPYSDDLFMSFLSNLRLWRYYNEKEKDEDDDRDNETRVRASLDLEPSRPRHNKKPEVEVVDRSEGTDAWSGKIW